MDRRTLFTRRSFLGGGIGVAATLLAGCGGEASTPTVTAPAARSGESAGTAAGERATGTPGAVAGTVPVGIITALTGAFPLPAQQFVEGFGYGIEYATGGTGMVGGRRITPVVEDDRGDSQVAARVARALLDRGYRILTGSSDGACALAVGQLAAERGALFLCGPATADTLTGLNRHTFRAGRQTYQDALAVRSLLARLPGKAVLLLAPDTVDGNALFGTLQPVLAVDERRDATLDWLRVPADTRDFGPFVRQALERRPDLFYVYWVGDGTDALWSALAREDAATRLRIITLLEPRATYPDLGPVAGRVALYAHYFAGATENAPNRYLIERVRARDDRLPDLAHPDGFAAAQLLAHAIATAGGDDIERMIGALEGYSFLGPKGEYSVRPEDHALLQPMFEARLVREAERYAPTLVETLPPSGTAPPVGPIFR